MKLSTKIIIGISIFIIVLFLVPLVFGYVFLMQNQGLMKEMMNFYSEELSTKTVDFVKINQQFAFSAEISTELEAEYVESLRAINVYNPNLPGDSNMEKSQLYITYFSANSFLTLNTVDILGIEKVTINGKEAILYTISKKLDVPNFPGQPSWRNFTHKALDIRVSEGSPSVFYSFAYKPELSEKEVSTFISSLNFE